MFKRLKHQLVKTIEKIPLLQIFIYNHLQYFRFLFPHDKDYYALQILFQKDEKRIFLDVGGNIGLSSIGFRELGFKKNKIYIFEPDEDLIEQYLKKLKKNTMILKFLILDYQIKTQSLSYIKLFIKKNFFTSTTALIRNILLRNYMTIMV